MLDVTMYRTRINSLLSGCLQNSQIAPSELMEAMRYAVLNKGKRLRPILVYLSGEALGVQTAQLDAAAIAVELIHCYSLVHDDLPCMDDADTRRGEPSCHIAHGVANAVLVGDALQSLAFKVLSDDKQNTDSDKVAMISTLAGAIGASGMIGGQLLDLLASADMSEASLRQVHHLKTGCLISASVQMGIIAANVETKPLHDRLINFAENFGLAYQIQDDILDVTASVEVLGKPTSQDADKLSFTKVMSIDEAKSLTESLFVSAKKHLSHLGKNADNLLSLTDTITKRAY